jgi:hypothetical protein
MITGGGNGVEWSFIFVTVCSLLFDFVVPSGTIKYTAFADLKVDL